MNSFNITIFVNTELVVRKLIFHGCAVLLGCLVAAVICFGLWFESSDLTFEGMPIHDWESQAVGKGGYFPTAKLPSLERMGPEYVPFWLTRLQKRDSVVTKIYGKLWSRSPGWVQQSVPKARPPGSQRKVAYVVLSNLHFSNGIPELIELSYSSDREVQYYAVNLHPKTRDRFEMVIHGRVDVQQPQCARSFKR